MSEQLKDKLLNHERHEKIVYDEGPHTYHYFPDGDKRKTKLAIEYSGITDWIGSFCEKFDADKVINKYYDHWQRIDHDEYGGLSKDEIKKLWSDKGNDARDKGNAIHKAIENCVNLGVYDEDMGFYIDRFWEVMDEKGIEPFVSEIVVYDEDIQRATPIDVVGLKDGKLFPMDLKTYEDGMEFSPYKGKSMKHPLGDLFDSKWEKVNLQISIARKWLVDNYGFEEEMVEDGATLLLNQDGCKYIPALDYRKYVERMYEYE